MGNDANVSKRDGFRSRGGFIIACIGSAVGMGNIWRFPTLVSKWGGMTFLLPYFLFVILIGSTGVIGEMSFGRATRSGPVHAFGEATRMRFGSDRPGKLLGLIPVLGSLALAIGYSVVTGWIFKYTFQSFTGSLSQMQGVAAFDANFGATAGGNIFWQLVGMAVTVVIMAFGIGRGIEKANKVMTPLFYLLFIGLAVYLATLPGAAEGYRYIFVLKPEGLLDPMVWVFALGQAFFSLSIAGNGTLIYCSYLGRDSDVPADAKMVALFDTLAAMLASLVIIPAMAVAGQQLDQSGPGLMFIDLPNVLSTIPGGWLILILFSGSNNHNGQRRVLGFQENTLVLRRETGTHDIVHGNDRSGYIVQASRKLCSFQLVELQMLRIFHDIGRGGFHAYAFFQLDQAGCFQKLQTAAFVGGIVRNGNNGAVRDILYILVLVGVDAHSHENGFSDGNKVCAVLFIEVLQERFVLVYNQVQVPVGQSLVGGDVVGEFLYIDFETVLCGFLCSGFHDFCMRAGSSAYGNFFLFLRSLSGGGSRLAVGTAACNDGCSGECT